MTYIGPKLAAKKLFSGEKPVDWGSKHYFYYFGEKKSSEKKNLACLDFFSRQIVEKIKCRGKQESDEWVFSLIFEWISECRVSWFLTGFEWSESVEWSFKNKNRVKLECRVSEKMKIFVKVKWSSSEILEWSWVKLS